MEISGLYQLYTSYPNIVTDSRSKVRDSIFFGIRGERFNGNLFAGKALENASVYAVVDDPEVVEDERYILVEDSIRTLQELSAYHRVRLNIPVIAITGSNGKTTTKDLAAEILSRQYNVRATTGNLNNHIGVPLTLLGMNSSTEVGIVEMGANHSGEITQLCMMAGPDYGLITNVGLAHLEGFGNLEGVRAAKGELFKYIESSGGLIFCNGGDRVLKEMLRDIDADVFYYGDTENSLCKGELLSSDPFLSLRLGLADMEDIEVRTGLVGSYNLENILAAVAIGLHFRISPDNIYNALEGWTTGNNRSQRLETAKNTLIMDAYNANPTSMKAAIENFSLLNHPRKVLVLGDMLELGENEQIEHRAILEQILSMDCEEVFLVGPVFSSLKLPGGIRAFTTVDELNDWLGIQTLSDSLILLKGSRGIGLERLKDKL